MSEEFRCTLANAEEPMAGTAPTDAAYLLVEQPGGWGRDALQQSRLPESVRSFLGSLPGVQAHLIRRPGGGGGPGVRVDSHAYTNYFVPPNYDSMIGKVIVHGDTREQALARMRMALNETVVEGIQTNIPLHRELMVDAKFVQGGTSIHYLEGWLSSHNR